MSTGSKRPGLSELNALQQQGFERVQQECKAIREAYPVKAERYKRLRDTYVTYAGVFEHAAENFYPEKYFANGMDREETANMLIETANESKGMLDGVIAAMSSEAHGNRRLSRNFDYYAGKHVCIINNLDHANQAFRTRGANLTSDSIGPMDIARLLVVSTGFSIFGKARPA